MTGFKSEFLLKNFGFEGIENADVFCMKLWRIPPGAILFYRCVASLYILCSTVASAWIQDHVRWLVYLTNWTLILYTIYYVVLTIFSAYYYFKTRKSEESETNQVFKSSIPRTITCFLFDLCFNATLLVTVMYWAFLYKDEDQEGRTAANEFKSINGHLVNFLLLLVDFMFHRIPVRILHALYPVTYGCIYIMFTAIYFAETKSNVYSILNWAEKPGISVVVCLMCIVFVIIIQFVYYALDRIKMKLDS